MNMNEAEWVEFCKQELDMWFDEFKRDEEQRRQVEEGVWEQLELPLGDPKQLELPLE